MKVDQYCIILQIFHQQNRGTKQKTFFMYLQFHKTLVSVGSARLVICNAFFAPVGGGGVPYIGYVGMWGAQGYVFLQLFWSEKGYQFRPFWSEIGYGLCTLVLNWVCFF